jgi:hypothetical protein
LIRDCEPRRDAQSKVCTCSLKSTNLSWVLRSRSSLKAMGGEGTRGRGEGSGHLVEGGGFGKGTNAEHAVYDWAGLVR